MGGFYTDPYVGAYSDPVQPQPPSTTTTTQTDPTITLDPNQTFAYYPTQAPPVFADPSAPALAPTPTATDPYASFWGAYSPTSQETTANKQYSDLYNNYYSNYWAPDRNAVLQSLQWNSAGPNSQLAQQVYGAAPWSGQGGGTSGGQLPSYVNQNDPISAAVWKAFQQKGLSPRDQGDFQYWVDKINQTGGWTPQNSSYWLSRMAQGQGGVGDYSGAPEAGGGFGGALGGGGFQAAGVFSDPATKAWNTYLNQTVGTLSQPYQPQDAGQFQDYLRKYFQQLQTPQQPADTAAYQDYLRKYMTQLQGPAYTPAEMELMQTQALDPLEQQRQAEIAQVYNRFAGLGQAASSGGVQQSINDINRRYDALRTQVQAGFANQAIGLTRQNAATAAQVGGTLMGYQQNQIANALAQQNQAAQIGGALTGYEQSIAQNNEQRMLQALGLLGQVPQLADSRLALANSVLGQSAINPTQLLASLNSFNQTAQQGQAYAFDQNAYNQLQQQKFWQMLANLFGKSGIFG